MAQAPPFGRLPVLEDVIPLSGPSRDWIEPSIPRGVPELPNNAPMVPPFGAPSVAMNPPMLPQGPTPGGAPQMPPQAQQGGPNFLGMALPMLAAMIAGRGDPVAIGTGMAAFQRGRELKRAEMESIEEREMRRSRERAEFYSRAVEQAQNIGDPLEFEQFKAAIKPYADLYDIPIDIFTFSDTKRQEKDRKLVADAIAVAVRRHGEEVVDRDDVTLQLADGRNITMREARQMTGGAVSAQGKPVPVNTKGATPLQGLQMMKAEAELMTPGADTRRPLEDRLLEAIQSGDKPLEQQIRTAMNARDVNMGGGSGNSGVQDARRFSMEQRLVAQWDKANTPQREMRRQLGLMESGLQRFRAGDTNGGSQAVLVTFQKILDPTSVVRESEYARTATGQSLMNRIEGFAQRLAAGGAGLTDGEMAAMVETARQFLAGMQDHTAGLRQRIGRTVSEYQLDPRMIFDDTGEPDTTPVIKPTGRYNPATGRVEPIQ